MSLLLAIFLKTGYDNYNFNKEKETFELWSEKQP